MMGDHLRLSRLEMWRKQDNEGQIKALLGARAKGSETGPTNSPAFPFADAKFKH